MVTALKDIITAVTAITLLAYSTGQQDWMWKQIVNLRLVTLAEVQKDWVCPSYSRINGPVSQEYVGSR